MMYKEDGKYYIKAIGFLPEDSLPNRREKIDYRALETVGECVITKGAIVDYNQVEDYIRNIENNFKCRIECIVADPFNATQMLLSLAEDYEVIELKQSYTNLSAPTKEFRNEVYKGNIIYEKSSDLLAATIFAFTQCYLMEESWTIQVI